MKRIKAVLTLHRGEDALQRAAQPRRQRLVVIQFREFREVGKAHA